MIWPIIGLAIAIFAYWLYWRRPVVAPQKPTITYYRKAGDMEKLRFTWPVSTSTFVDHQEVLVSVNGGAYANVGGQLPSSQNMLLADFNTGDKIRVKVKAVGDNASEATSVESDEFTVANLEQVVAPGKPSVAWVSHIP